MGMPSLILIFNFKEKKRKNPRNLREYRSAAIFFSRIKRTFKFNCHNYCYNIYE